MKDKFGAELHENDYVVYATRIADTAELKLGIVTKVSNTKVGVRGIHDRYSFQPATLGKMTTLTYSDRIAKVDRQQLPDKSVNLLLQAVKSTGEYV